MPDKIQFIFESPEKSPGYLLAQLTLLWQRKQKKVLDPLDLTHTQFVLLTSIAWLTNKGENITQVEIANLNNYDRMMVSKVLRTLEEKKLITRKVHSTDTRAKIVELTTNGRNILQTALTNVEEADIEFFASINKNLSNFNDYLQTLIKANQGD